jgi:uncharacterized protein (TIGR02217 family)
MAWNSTKTQIWDTKIQKYGSGRRKTLSRWPYPQWEIDCDYTCLDRDELEYTAGFFAKVRGQFQPFLWKDDQDYKQTGVQIGIGNGSTTGFQLIRNYGGFVEPVLDIVAGTLTAYENDVAKTVTLGEDGWIEFSTAPASGALITASFEYYWRVAFAKDEKTWENFWYDFYRLKSIKLVTVK